MARFQGAAAIAGNAVAAATVETLIQLLAAANHRVALLGYNLGGNGTSNTEGPGLIQIVRQTTAGTASALTLVKGDDSIAESLLTTGQELFTAEPTLGDILRPHTVHPQASISIMDSFSREYIMGGGDRIAMRANYPEAQTLDAGMDFEE